MGAGGFPESLPDEWLPSSGTRSDASRCPGPPSLGCSCVGCRLRDGVHDFAQVRVDLFFDVFVVRLEIGAELRKAEDLHMYAVGYGALVMTPSTVNVASASATDPTSPEIGP